MTDTTDETNEQLTEDQIAEQQRQDEAAFLEGFTGEDSPASSNQEQPASTETASAEAQPAEQSSAEDEPPARVLAGMTEEELKGLLAKVSRLDDLEAELHRTRDGLHGRYGELQRSMQEMKQQAPTAQAGANMRFSPEKFKRLQESFPELAEDLLADLSEAFVPGESVPVDLDQQIGSRVAQVRSELEFEMQSNLLTFMRPDWQTLKATDDFALFKSQMSKEDLTAYSSSRDAFYLKDVFDKFDAWKQSAADAQKLANSKRERLEGAMTPRGTQPNVAGTAALSDAAAFAAGWDEAGGVG